MLQVGPLKPVNSHLQLDPPVMFLKHDPPFWQGLGKQESMVIEINLIPIVQRTI